MVLQYRSQWLQNDQRWCCWMGGCGELGKRSQHPVRLQCCAGHSVVAAACSCRSRSFMSSDPFAWPDHYAAPTSPSRLARAEKGTAHHALEPLSPVSTRRTAEPLSYSSSSSSSAVSASPHSLLSPVFPMSPPSLFADDEATTSASWPFSPPSPLPPPQYSMSPLPRPSPSSSHLFHAAAPTRVGGSSLPDSPSSLSLSSSHSPSPPLPSALFSPAVRPYEPPDDSATTTVTKRPRAAFEEEQESGAVMSSRRSHRQLDATRRAKESAALKKLDQLTARQRRERREASGSSASRDTTAPRDKGNGEESERKAATHSKKREKLTVLEASISHIERLQALVERLTEAGQAKDRRMQEVTHHLRSLATKCAQMEERMATSDSSSALSPHSSSPSSSSSSPSSILSLLSSFDAEYVSYLDSHHALYSSIFLHSGLVMMLMDLDTAVIIDANSRFAEQTGFVREDIIGRRINGKGGQDEESRAQAAQYEVVRIRDRSAKGRDRARARLARGGSARDSGAEEEAGTGEEDGEDGELPWIESPMVRQYPSSLSLLQELREGKRDSFRAPWRCLFADGRLVEVESMCVVAKRRWVVEAEGTTWERPTSLLVANGWTDTVPIDISNEERPSSMN